MGLGNNASAFTNAQNLPETSASATNGGNGGANGIPLTVQGAIAQGLNMGFQYPNTQFPMSESFMQRSPAEQAQAAYAAAAMAEKRLAISSRGNEKKDSSENNSLDAGNGLPATIAPSNGTNNSYSSDKMNQVSMLMGSAAPASNFAVNPAFANVLFPGAVQGFFNPANGAVPGANVMPQNLLAQAGYGYQLPQGLGAMSLPGNASLAGSALPSAFASSVNQSQVPITSTSSPTGLMPVAAIPHKKKKVKGKPKRPLSAYNLFFKHERQRILASLTQEAEQAEESENNDAAKGDTDKDKDQESNGDDAKNIKVEDQSSSSDNKTSTEDKSSTDDKTSSDDKVSDKEKDQPEGQDEKDLAAKKKKPHGKIGFETLAKTIGQRWAKLEPDELKKYKDLAHEDMKRYKSEMEIFLTKRQDTDAQERSVQAAESQAPGNVTAGNEAKAFDQQFQMQLLQQQAAQASPWGAVMNNGMNPAQVQNYAMNPNALQSNMLMQALLVQQMKQQQQQQQQFNQQQQQQQLMMNQQSMQAQLQSQLQSDGGQDEDNSEHSSKKQKTDAQDPYQHQSFAPFGLQPGAGAMGNAAPNGMSNVSNGMYGGNFNPSMNGGDLLSNMNNMQVMMAMGNSMNNMQQQQQQQGQQNGQQQQNVNGPTAPGSASLYSSGGGGVSPSMFNMGQ